MLDAPTKARIDSARDILVGKVPDPKSQVEQITIALIYKFMDDMDRQSEELGGKASFFQGEFRKYRWADLLDKRFGGHERLALYAEGIERMNQNQNIPQLFRDIFKGVFLPYRDPETLNLFLKEINGFTYEHSERLGDAYEYLLNVLGTQGDAGQFRTPRHIIDFIVTVMDPQKHETLLDPACGTAGFLISAYKHILAENCPNSPPRPARPTAPLTPDERARLMTNFCGYDIAPDMVRLSRVNLYLHGFPNPVIHEYDTLTSEERWDERYDVIMANPPFMTPKGGIRPHQRFSIKAKRSEVLFVDYIAEHLNPGGRAGIIVPEGIIFQSQNAYKNLRKMLVENYLWAAVSLPAGVFNPYSGVKTSILFLDRALARRAADVLFVKIENDGFDLGAQRRPIEKNDLPAALRALQEWKAAPHPSRPPRPAGQAGSTHAVPRQRLLAAPDISLSGDRYRAVEVRPGKWPMVKLGDVCRQNRKIVEPNSKLAAKLPYLSLEDVESETGRILKVPAPNNSVGKSTSFYFDSNHVLYGKLRPYLNKVALPDFSGRCTTELIPLLPNDRLNREFLAYLLRSSHIVARAMHGRTGSRMPRADMDVLLATEIPLPPLAEQERLVAELEGYRQIIEAARQILTHYKPTLRIDPKWPVVAVGEALEDVKYSPKVQKSEFLEAGKYPIVDQSEKFIAGYWNDARALFRLSKPVVLFGDHTRALKYVDFDFVLGADGVKILQPDDRFVPRFFHYALLNAEIPELGYSRHFKELVRVSIAVPPLKVQREIVAELEAERALVEANRALIARMEQKLAAKLAEIWGAPEKG